MVELADTQDLGSCAVRCAGSSPVIRTKKENQSEHFFIICSDWFFVSFYIILLLPAMPLKLPLAW